jgi:hypothetical protein
MDKATFGIYVKRTYCIVSLNILLLYSKQGDLFLCRINLLCDKLEMTREKVLLEYNSREVE